MDITLFVFVEIEALDITLFVFVEIEALVEIDIFLAMELVVDS